MADGNRMVFLGFGKYARADKIYAIEPIRDERRGHGRRTLVWVEGVSEPIVASRTERTILADMGQEQALGKPILDEALDLAQRLVRAVAERQGRPGRPRPPRTPPARGDRPPGRPGQALLATREMEPSEIREPGMIRRLAIDLGPLRRHPPFRRLFIGQTISTFGSEIAAVAAPFQLYQLTHSTLQVGLLSLCELFPLLTLTIVGGALADAIDKRKLLLVTEVLLAFVALGFAFNASLDQPRVWAIYVLVTLAMSIFSLGVAGMNSAIPRLVDQSELSAAIAIENVYGSTTNVAGPALGGVLIAVLGLKGAYLLDAATFTASLWSVWRLPALAPAHDAERPSLRTIAEGFRFVRTKKVLLGMFLVDSNAMVFGMPRALFPALALNRFDGGAGVLGLMYAAPYAGALAASLVSGWIGHVRRQGLIVADRGRALGRGDRRSSASPRRSGSRCCCSPRPGAADNVSAVLRGTILWSGHARPASGPRLRDRVRAGRGDARARERRGRPRRLADERALLDRLGRLPLRRRYGRDRPCRPRLHPLRRARSRLTPSPAASTRSRPR